MRVFDASSLFVFSISDNEPFTEFGLATVFCWVSGETRLTDEIVVRDEDTFFKFVDGLLRHQ